MRLIVFISLAWLAAAGSASAQRPVNVAPNAAADRPVGARERCQWEAAVRAMEPYVTRARASYPEAKARFLAGLPARHTFFVAIRLADTAGHHEQVFLAVDSIANGRVAGRIWSEIAIVAGFRLKQPHEVPESEIVDWMIARPDGTEEGNVVGVFLDTYQPPPCRDA